MQPLGADRMFASAQFQLQPVFVLNAITISSRFTYSHLLINTFPFFASILLLTINIFEVLRL